MGEEERLGAHACRTDLQQLLPKEEFPLAISCMTKTVRDILQER
jgi:hypothetical protein